MKTKVVIYANTNDAINVGCVLNAEQSLDVINNTHVKLVMHKRV